MTKRRADEGKADQPSAIALIANLQPLRLVRAFNTIGDKGVRRSLMTLTEAIARAPAGRPSPGATPPAAQDRINAMEPGAPSRVSPASWPTEPASSSSDTPSAPSRRP